MRCPNCNDWHPIRTGTTLLPDGDERRYKCPTCKYIWRTVECIKEQQERQADQAYYFRVMISKEARETARAIMERNGLDATRREENNASLGYRSTTGRPSDSAPDTVTGNGAAADGAPGAGS